MRSRLALALGLVLLSACGGGGGGGSTVRPPTAGNTPPPAPTPTPVPSPTPAALNVTGGWHSEARSWNFHLDQNGGALTGVVLGFKNISYPDPSDPVLQISGTITANGTVAFKAPVFALDFSGNVEPGGLRMTGTLFDCANNCRNYGEVLTKQ